MKFLGLSLKALPSVDTHFTPPPHDLFLRIVTALWKAEERAAGVPDELQSPHTQGVTAATP